ncbi:GNAT family N-acetyltransferase [Oscillochloris sp. ZM17-4]|uniref:GNAT family N-acetyltransferase n=1 Tax=Oscillochloris sp. ZM17-4 TaxID=2866714 RepID=UPI001C72B5E7|nr:GNAT family N-acetyltransferase [Oscillochloris sp. ZM17-4]MBX0330130.1 GNAT family N-acetyltransferase [Oscillochloris sp. ZM17-4]
MVRPATADDQPAIVDLVRAAKINPTGLHWPRFLVAEVDGRVVGTAQIKPHRDGSRELASLAVAPEMQGQGIGGALVGTLLRGASPPIYLTCVDRLEGYYARFGFRALDRAEMPPDLRRIHRAMNLLMRLVSRGRRLLVMRWDAESAAG